MESGYTNANKLAEKLGISASKYSQHETTKRSINIESLMQYANALDINPAWLLTGQGSPCTDTGDNGERGKRILDVIDKLEKMGAIEASKAPLIESQQVISYIHTELFRNILVHIVPLIKEHPEPKSNEEIVDFLFDMYNKVVMSNVDDKSRQLLIRMCIESFFKGLKSSTASQIADKVIGLDG